MQYYGINQTELCKRTGIQKSALSNYLNGDREPRQDQISLISDPFGINPAWLMGYDVPMMLSRSAEDTQIQEAIELYDRIQKLPKDKQIALQNYLQFLQSDS